MSDLDLCAWCGIPRVEHDESTFTAEDDVSGMTAEAIETARAEHDG